MSMADHAYYIRRAEEERSSVARAKTPEAKVVHQQLCELYLARADASPNVFEPTVPAYGNA